VSYLTRKDGVRVYYEVTGGGDAQPLVLSHGFGSSSRMWAGNTAALAANRPVITWDLRGHGRSDSPERQDLYTAEASVADLAALLDETGTEQAVIGGLSLGGYLSLRFYLAHPHRVAALILCDTGPGFRDDQARDDWNARARAQADRIDRDGQAALGGDSAHHQSAAGVARAARGILTQHDATVIESLPAIAVPALVLVGSRDTPFLGAASYMAAKIPGAKHVLVNDAGHVSNIDAPAEFNEAVLAFLSRIKEVPDAR
jgi:pimeloyl-ACP methyl ester carboxylesterase